MDPDTTPISVHLVILGLCAVFLLAGCLLETDGDKVLVAGRPLPSICWLRRTQLGGCPGCGLTRSVVAMCHLEPRQSLLLHPSGAVFVVLAFLELPYRLVRLRGKASRALRAWGTALEYCLLLGGLGVSVVAWLARQLFF